MILMPPVERHTFETVPVMGTGFRTGAVIAVFLYLFHEFLFQPPGLLAVSGTGGLDFLFHQLISVNFHVRFLPY